MEPFTGFTTYKDVPCGDFRDDAFKTEVKPVPKDSSDYWDKFWPAQKSVKPVPQSRFSLLFGGGTCEDPHCSCHQEAADRAMVGEFTQTYAEMKVELATKLERARLNLNAALDAIPKVPTIDEAIGSFIRHWMYMELRMAENLEAYGVEFGPPSPFTHPHMFGDWEQVRRVLATYGPVDEDDLRWMK